MNRKVFFWSTLVTGVVFTLACSGLRFVLPDRGLQTAPAVVTAVATTSVPLQTPATYPRNCSYTWAYKSLPELSEQVRAEVRKIYPDAEAHAQAYGEDCIYSDGHVDYIALETDYFVTLNITDLGDDSLAGAMIRRATDHLLTRFPTGVTPGPKPGQFTYRFTSGERERYVSFETAEFQKLPSDLTGADLITALAR